MTLFTNEFGPWKVVDTERHEMLNFYKTYEAALEVATTLNRYEPEEDPQDEWENDLIYGDGDA